MRLQPSLFCSWISGFQFTHPVRGATITSPIYLRIGAVSIHAPRAGCDVELPALAGGIDVSIHAPRAGCDDPEAGQYFTSISFNSRTPCGVRLCHCCFIVWCKEFQFTHPVRGATEAIQHRRSPPRRFNSRTPCGVRLQHHQTQWKTSTFQFTHPVRGATSRSDSRRRRKKSFNSRTPCGVRLGWSVILI